MSPRSTVNSRQTASTSPAPGTPQAVSAPLVDMHCHLDFFEDPAFIAREAAQLELSFLAVSCAPHDYLAHQAELESLSNVCFACGLHPWWIAQERVAEEELDTLLELMAETRFIGEVGLDFSERHVPRESFEKQTRAFTRIARKAAETKNKLLSIHAVKAAGTVLDILEDAGALDSCDVIFHWFSGSADELHRAIQAGCYLSINPMMLKTRRAHEYMKLIPPTQLLLESDYPPETDNAHITAKDLYSLLDEASAQLGEWLLRDIKDETTINARRLLGC